MLAVAQSAAGVQRARAAQRMSRRRPSPPQPRRVSAHARRVPQRVQPCGKRTKSSVLPRGATKKVKKKAAFGARRRLEKKARRAEARAKGASPAQQAAPWQGKRAADAGKGPAKKKKKKEGKKFVGKRKT